MDDSTTTALIDQVIIDSRRITSPDTLLVPPSNSRKDSVEQLTTLCDGSISNNQLLINLDAVHANIEAIRAKLPPSTRILVMVKAMAYGTDDVHMAKFLSQCGVDILGVSYVDEGIALRRACVTQPLFVLNAAIYEVSKAVQWGLEIGVGDAKMIHALAYEASLQNKVIKVHLHVDTGMRRFGCRP